MNFYQIHIETPTDVQSLLVDAKGNCTINSIVYNVGEEEILPLNALTLPISLTAGKKLLLFDSPVQASYIELLGTNLENIQGVSLNDSTLAKNLQDQIDTIIAGTTSYTHTQDVPSDTWMINHSLGYNPNVAVVDSTGAVVVGDLEYVSISKIVVRFNGGFAGKAYLS